MTAGGWHRVKGKGDGFFPVATFGVAINLAYRYALSALRRFSAWLAATATAVRIQAVLPRVIVPVLRVATRGIARVSATITAVARATAVVA